MSVEAAERKHVSKKCVLMNGELVTFRLLQKTDEAALRMFFEQLSEEEINTLRDDVRDPSTISFWIERLDYRHVFPIIALDESLDRIVGVSTLHFMTGVSRHVADVRVVVARSHRKLGLGSALIKELVQVGDQLGIHHLRAEILSDNQLAIVAFRQLGFEAVCMVEDYFLTRDGKTRAVTLMHKRLRMNQGELSSAF